MTKHAAAALAALTMTALTLGATRTASAQQVPSYAQPPGPSADVQIRGHIADFDGRYSLTVRDERGYLDNVRLHPGTIINPTGLTLAPGMVVSILGYNAGTEFAANEIDTPYTFYAGTPSYYGHPWSYYGPAFSLGFFFGNPGWWHGTYFYGGYHYAGGARVYNNVRFQNVYHGGAYNGHAYVVPPGRGGYYYGHAQGGDGYGRGGYGHH